MAFAFAIVSLAVTHGRAQSVAEEDRTEAAHSYDRALVLFDRGEARAALSEFERAYQLSPAFKILYNIAVVNVALDDPAAALRAFERYLTEGGERVDRQRHGEVDRQVLALSHKAGALSVDVDARDSTVLVDETEVGKSPIVKLWLNVGRHRVQVRSSDGRAQAQAVDVAAGDEPTLHFILNGPRAIAETRSSVVPKAAAPDKRLPWFAYGITATIGVSAAVVGGLALAASRDERAVQLRQTTPQELQDARHKVEHLALATDLLLAGTLISGGVALYLTLHRPQQPPTISLVLGPGRLSVVGAF